MKTQDGRKKALPVGKSKIRAPGKVCMLDGLHDGGLFPIKHSEIGSTGKLI